MILHIFTQVSDYSIEFIRMLADKFDLSQHIVVFRSEKGKFEKLRNPDLKILLLADRRDFLEHMPSLVIKADRLIFHSFPVSRSLLFWYPYRKYMKKAIWSVWGQDAYWFKYCRKNVVNLLYEIIRRILIKKLDKILCPIREDYEYIRERYGIRATRIDAMYPIPTDFSLLDQLRKGKKKKDLINIQVGNSANPTNNLSEVLSFLARHVTANYRVYCPLSYGDREYAKKVIEQGKRELGEKFVPLTTFLNRNEYAKLIADIDVLIMNHQRQQGLGNIFSYLYLGKKVYLRKDNSSFNFFKEQGITVFDTQELLNSKELSGLIAMDKQLSEMNISKTRDIISVEKIAQDWGEVLTLNI